MDGMNADERQDGFEFGLGIWVLCGTNRGGAEVAEEARRKAVDGGEFEMRGCRSLDQDGWDDRRFRNEFFEAWDRSRRSQWGCRVWREVIFQGLI
jgi:hypothetical protein